MVWNQDLSGRGATVLPQTGNIKNYIKSLEMQHKWNQRKKNPGMRQTDSCVAQMQKQLEEQRRKQSLGAITARLESGKKLSAAEMDYLRQNRPELYMKAKKLAYEREAYERRLRNCKTKEEVRLVRMSKTAGLMSDVQVAERAGSGDLAGDVRQRAAAIDDSHVRFTGTRQYRALPADEHEHAKRRKEQAKKGGGASGSARGVAADELLFYDKQALKRKMADLNLRNYLAQAPPALSVDALTARAYGNEPEAAFPADKAEPPERSSEPPTPRKRMSRNI